MRIISIATAVLISLFALTSAGCESSGNPFAGSTWTAGTHTVSFSHGVADWSTADNMIVLKFDLITGASLPDATAAIPEISTLKVNESRGVAITLAISSSLHFTADPSDPDANANIVLTRLDLGPLGAVSGTITGKVRSVENPSQILDLNASFSDAPIAN
ncbi:MAG TPA: hypothetical protein VGB30_09200 [bacterium]